MNKSKSENQGLHRPAVQLNLLDAIKKKDEGLQQAMAHADSKHAGWMDKAYAHFIQWLFGKPKGFEFQIEDFRAHASKAGLPMPPNNRAFGGIPIRARKDLLIEFVRIEKTDNVKAHRAHSSVWKKL